MINVGDIVRLKDARIGTLSLGIVYNIDNHIHRHNSNDKFRICYIKYFDKDNPFNKKILECMLIKINV